MKIAVKGNEFTSFVELHELFPPADRVGKLKIREVGDARVIVGYLAGN